jgi:hypothetical protein
MRYLTLLMLTLLSPACYGALRIDAIVYNKDKTAVELLYSDGKSLVRIEANQSRRIRFPSAPTPLLIKIGTATYQCNCKFVPVGFRKAGFAKSTCKIVICNEGLLYLIPPETPDEKVTETAKTQTQPKGWPMRGILQKKTVQ